MPEHSVAPTDELPAWFDVKRAAQYLGFSTSQLREFAKSGELRGVRVHRRWRFQRAWLDAFVMGENPQAAARVATGQRKPPKEIKVVDGRVRIEL